MLTPGEAAGAKKRREEQRFLFWPLPSHVCARVPTTLLPLDRFFLARGTPVVCMPWDASNQNQIRANVTKLGWDSDSYYEFNVPETESLTENNCKSPTDCPGDDEGRIIFPWTAVSKGSAMSAFECSPLSRADGSPRARERSWRPIGRVVCWRPVGRMVFGVPSVVSSSVSSPPAFVLVFLARLAAFVFCVVRLRETTDQTQQSARNTPLSQNQVHGHTHSFV